ncbi:MAG: hypothetical protein VR65_05630 [Desulfobulbaceae bacterium BRH_c16a]|nr:MAG: hypothetical protein VR65_05630 [Desulfobulbaceae bacterium BRH_c16a]
MNTWRKSLILPALWGMDLSWLYAWAAVIMLAGFGMPFSQASALLPAVSATVLTLFIRHRGWRNYQIVGVHALGLILACAAVIHDLEQPASPFYHFSWLLEFPATPKTPGHWLLLAAALFWSIVFWIAGTRLALIPRDHITISNHFDLGVISLVLLHLFEMLLAVKGGITLVGLSLPRVLFAFFIFSVLAFCLARCRGDGKSDFIVGFRGIGVVVSFMTALLLLGSGVTALFLPFLTVAAETGVAVLKTITAPAGNLIVNILSFFFGRGKLLSDQAGSQTTRNPGLQEVSFQQAEGWQALLQQILLYLTAGLGVVAVVMLFILLVWQTGWWLSQKTGKGRPGSSPWQMFRELIGAVLAAVAALIGKLQVTSRRPPDPVQLYLALTAWGGSSGLAFIPSETPRQYGERLSKRFPALREEFLLIIAVHDRAVYGERLEPSGQLQSARLACRRLHSFRLWPIRLKTLLFF